MGAKTFDKPSDPVLSTTTKVVGGGRAQVGSGRWLQPEHITARVVASRHPLDTTGVWFDIGDDDLVTVLNPNQTASTSSRMGAFDDLAGSDTLCDYAFTKRIGLMCKAYKAVVRTQWLVNDWFLWNATQNNACGVMVIDGSPLRPPLVRPATRASDGLGVVFIRPGQTETIRMSDGPTLPLSCPA